MSHSWLVETAGEKVALVIGKKNFLLLNPVSLEVNACIDLSSIKEVCGAIDCDCTIYLKGANLFGAGLCLVAMSDRDAVHIMVTLMMESRCFGEVSTEIQFILSNINYDSSSEVTLRISTAQVYDNETINNVMGPLTPRMILGSADYVVYLTETELGMAHVENGISLLTLALKDISRIHTDEGCTIQTRDGRFICFTSSDDVCAFVLLCSARVAKNTFLFVDDAVLTNTFRFADNVESSKEKTQSAVRSNTIQFPGHVEVSQEKTEEQVLEIAQAILSQSQRRNNARKNLTVSPLGELINTAIENEESLLIEEKKLEFKPKIPSRIEIEPVIPSPIEIEHASIPLLIEIKHTVPSLPSSMEIKHTVASSPSPIEIKHTAPSLPSSMEIKPVAPSPIEENKAAGIETERLNVEKERIAELKMETRPANLHVSFSDQADKNSKRSKGCKQQ